MQLAQIHPRVSHCVPCLSQGIGNVAYRHDERSFQSFFSVRCLPEKDKSEIAVFQNFDVIETIGIQVCDRERFGKHGYPREVRVAQRSSTSRSRLIRASHISRDVNSGVPKRLTRYYRAKSQLRDSIPDATPAGAVVAIPSGVTAGETALHSNSPATSFPQADMAGALNPSRQGVPAASHSRAS